MNIDIGKLLDNIRLGNSFRAFGGLCLITSIWVSNELALKISLITFIFGGLSRPIEILNELYPKNNLLHFLVWVTFLIFYSFIINNQISIF